MRRALGFNWDFLRKIIVILATMSLAAGRTALTLFIESRAAATVLTRFGLAEEFINSYALGMAFLSLLAIEGYLVNFGIDRGKLVGELNEAGVLITSAIPAKYALGIVISISVLAGVGVSIAPVQWLDAIGGEAIRVVLGLVVGAGVSIMAYAAGEDLGKSMRRKDRIDEHWEEAMRRAWLSSRDRRQLLYRFLYEEVADEPAPAPTLEPGKPQLNGNLSDRWASTNELIEWYAQRHSLPLTAELNLSAEAIAQEACAELRVSPGRDEMILLEGRLRKALQRLRKRLAESLN